MFICAFRVTGIPRSGDILSSIMLSYTSSSALPWVRTSPRRVPPSPLPPHVDASCRPGLGTFAFLLSVLGPSARAAGVPRPLLGRLTRTFIWVPRAPYTSMTEGATFSTNAFRNDTAQCVPQAEFWRTLKSPVFNQECCPTEATILSHLRPPKRHSIPRRPCAHLEF